VSALAEPVDATACTEPAIGTDYEAYRCRVNDVTPEALFARYSEAGFLYEAKLARLKPFMPAITENWRKALRAGELVHWVATFDQPNLGAWASISSWRSTHRGWNTQHLVGIGGPTGSRAVMLAGQAVRIRDGFDAAHQNWFRPDNRFPNRLFGSIVDSVGQELAVVVPHQMLSIPVNRARFLTSHLPVRAQEQPEEVGVHSLAVATRGAVFASAEELDHEDLLLEQVDDLYAMVGLRRYRRIFVAWEHDIPLGAAIVWRGPLGFNFSFLENRCDLLFAPGLPFWRRQAVARALLARAATCYRDFEPAEIPIVVLGIDGSVVAAVGATPIRHYTQSIWLKDAFELMYGHFAHFYRRLERATSRAGVVAVPTLSTPNGEHDHVG
jgi:hypothetical protein